MPVNLNLRKKLSDNLGVNLNLRDIFGKFNKGNTNISDSESLRTSKGNDITDFKSRMNSFARPNLFEVTVFPKPDNINKNVHERLKFSCHQATIPGMSMATTDKDPGYRSFAYQKLYEDVTLGFYVHGDMKEIKVFQDWMKLMINPKNNHVGFYTNYVSTVEIKNLDRQQKQVLTTTLHDAYPKQLETIALDANANDDVMKVNVVFTYRYYTQKFGGNQETVGGLTDREESLRYYENNMEEVDVDAVQVNQVLDKTTKIKKLGDSWKTWTKQ